jgi:hypothetical protein
MPVARCIIEIGTENFLVDVKPELESVYLVLVAKHPVIVPVDAGGEHTCKAVAEVMFPLQVNVPVTIAVAGIVI